MCLSRSTGILKHTADEVARNIPILDSAMFVRHNLAQWDEPVEFAFEPSPIWHDDANIVTDEYAKVFLRNMVSKSREGLGRIQPGIAVKHAAVNDLRASIQKSDNRETVSSVCPSVCI
jgi:formin-binding protein 1